MKATTAKSSEKSPNKSFNQDGMSLNTGGISPPKRVKRNSVYGSKTHYEALDNSNPEPTPQAINTAENSYRRGVHQALYRAARMLEQGADVDALFVAAHVASKMRYDMKPHPNYLDEIEYRVFDKRKPDGTWKRPMYLRF